jgi:hypothetical protein
MKKQVLKDCLMPMQKNDFDSANHRKILFYAGKNYLNPYNIEIEGNYNSSSPNFDHNYSSFNEDLTLLNYGTNYKVNTFISRFNSNVFGNSINERKLSHFSLYSYDFKDKLYNKLNNVFKIKLNYNLNRKYKESLKKITVVLKNKLKRSDLLIKRMHQFSKIQNIKQLLLFNLWKLKPNNELSKISKIVDTNKSVEIDINCDKSSNLLLMNRDDFSLMKKEMDKRIEENLDLLKQNTDLKVKIDEFCKNIEITKKDLQDREGLLNKQSETGKCLLMQKIEFKFLSTKTDAFKSIQRYIENKSKFEAEVENKNLTKIINSSTFKNTNLENNTNFSYLKTEKKFDIQNYNMTINQDYSTNQKLKENYEDLKNTLIDERLIFTNKNINNLENFHYENQSTDDKNEISLLKNSIIQDLKCNLSKSNLLIKIISNLKKSKDLNTNRSIYKSFFNWYDSVKNNKISEFSLNQKLTADTLNEKDNLIKEYKVEKEDLKLELDEKILQLDYIKKLCNETISENKKLKDDYCSLNLDYVMIKEDNQNKNEKIKSSSISNLLIKKLRNENELKLNKFARFINKLKSISESSLIKFLEIKQNEIDEKVIENNDLKSANIEKELISKRILPLLINRKNRDLTSKMFFKFLNRYMLKNRIMMMEEKVKLESILNLSSFNNILEDKQNRIEIDITSSKDLTNLKIENSDNLFIEQDYNKEDIIVSSQNEIFEDFKTNFAIPNRSIKNMSYKDEILTAVSLDFKIKSTLKKNIENKLKQIQFSSENNKSKYFLKWFANSKIYNINILSSILADESKSKENTQQLNQNLQEDSIKLNEIIDTLKVEKKELHENLERINSDFNKIKNESDQLVELNWKLSEQNINNQNSVKKLNICTFVSVLEKFTSINLNNYIYKFFISLLKLNSNNLGESLKKEMKNKEELMLSKNDQEIELNRIKQDFNEHALSNTNKIKDIYLKMFIQKTEKINKFNMLKNFNAIKEKTNSIKKLEENEIKNEQEIIDKINMMKESKLDFSKKSNLANAESFSFLINEELKNTIVAIRNKRIIELSNRIEILNFKNKPYNIKNLEINFDLISKTILKEFKVEKADDFTFNKISETLLDKKTKFLVKVLLNKEINVSSNSKEKLNSISVKYCFITWKNMMLINNLESRIEELKSTSMQIEKSKSIVKILFSSILKNKKENILKRNFQLLLLKTNFINNDINLIKTKESLKNLLLKSFINKNMQNQNTTLRKSFNSLFSNIMRNNKIKLENTLKEIKLISEKTENNHQDYEDNDDILENILKYNDDLSKSYILNKLVDKNESKIIFNEKDMRFWFRKFYSLSNEKQDKNYLDLYNAKLNDDLKIVFTENDLRFIDINNSTNKHLILKKDNMKFDENNKTENNFELSPLLETRNKLLNNLINKSSLLETSNIRFDHEKLYCFYRIESESIEILNSEVKKDRSLSTNLKKKEVNFKLPVNEILDRTKDLVSTFRNNKHEDNVEYMVSSKSMKNLSDNKFESIPNNEIDGFGDFSFEGIDDDDNNENNFHGLATSVSYCNFNQSQNQIKLNYTPFEARLKLRKMKRNANKKKLEIEKNDINIKNKQSTDINQANEKVSYILNSENFSILNKKNENVNENKLSSFTINLISAFDNKKVLDIHSINGFEILNHKLNDHDEIDNLKNSNFIEKEEKINSNELRPNDIIIHKANEFELLNELKLPHQPSFSEENQIVFSNLSYKKLISCSKIIDKADLRLKLISIAFNSFKSHSRISLKSSVIEKNAELEFFNNFRILERNYLVDLQQSFTLVDIENKNHNKISNKDFIDEKPEKQENTNKLTNISLEIISINNKLGKEVIIETVSKIEILSKDISKQIPDINKKPITKFKSLNKLKLNQNVLEEVETEEIDNSSINLKCNIEMSNYNDITEKNNISLEPSNYQLTPINHNLNKMLNDYKSNCINIKPNFLVTNLSNKDSSSNTNENNDKIVLLSNVEDNKNDFNNNDNNDELTTSNPSIKKEKIILKQTRRSLVNNKDSSTSNKINKENNFKINNENTKDDPKNDGKELKINVVELKDDGKNIIKENEIKKEISFNPKILNKIENNSNENDYKVENYDNTDVNKKFASLNSNNTTSSKMNDKKRLVKVRRSRHNTNESSLSLSNDMNSINANLNVNEGNNINDNNQILVNFKNSIESPSYQNSNFYHKCSILAKKTNEPVIEEILTEKKDGKLIIKKKIVQTNIINTYDNPNKLKINLNRLSQLSQEFDSDNKITTVSNRHTITNSSYRNKYGFTCIDNEEEIINTENVTDKNSLLRNYKQSNNIHNKSLSTRNSKK